MPIGAFLGGLIAERFGVESVFVLAGVLTLSMLAFRAFLSDATIGAAIDATQLPGPAAGGSAAP